MARATPDDLDLIERATAWIGVGSGTASTTECSHLAVALTRMVQRMREEDAAWVGRRLHFEVDTDNRLVMVARPTLADEPPLGIPFAYFKRTTGLILAHEAEQDRIVREAEGKPHTVGNDMRAAIAKNLITEADAEVAASRASAELRTDAPPPPPTERRQIPGVDY